MTPEQLLYECATLTHNGRMSRMVQLGRMAAEDASIATTIAAFEQGNVYQRALALQSCYGSRDTAHILRALADPSRFVRGLAVGLAAQICSASEVLAALPSLLPDLKVVLLRNLYRRRRQSIIDTYIETLAANNDNLLKKLLPSGSRETVTRHFGQIADRLELTTWHRLARRYPDLVIEQLSAQAAASSSYDPILVLRINTALGPLARFSPNLTLDFVQTLSETIPLARLSLQELVQKRPDEMAELVLRSNEQSSLRFTKVAHRLKDEHLAALLTNYPDTINKTCFHKLTPAQRLVVYTACERGWRNDEGILPHFIVADLPTEQRLKEGRRHLALPELVTRPRERFSYATFLPWDEASAMLKTPSRSPDAELRGAALQAFIAATRYERAHLADALQAVRARRNEQDPVRGQMLTALANLPHGIWHSEHLDALAQIISDALNATDLSRTTTQAVEQIVVHLFPFHPEWSAVQMAAIYSKRGYVSIFQLERYLSAADIRRIAPTLMPILTAWQKRESEGLLVMLAYALGKRLQNFDELAELLAVVAKNTLDRTRAESALRMLLKHHRERATTIIPELLKRDQSVATLSSVHTYLHRHRQDLITPFLGQRAYKGRFSTGKTRFVLPLNNGFQRWTPEQQQIFAETLLQVAKSDKKQHRTSFELLSAIRRLAAMPDLDPAPIIQLASDEQQVVRESALRVLGRLDAGQGVPALLVALNDERARIAIYALRRALLSMPPAQALDLLRSAPLTEVTVAKEVVRLIGDLSTEEAYRALLALEARELHRDVRVALLRALWPYTEYAETWEIFTRAAQAPEAALARGVAHIPVDGLSTAAQKRLATLLATLLEHPEPEVRMDTLRRCRQQPLADTEHTIFPRLLSLMSSSLPDECELAAGTIFALYAEKDVSLVSNVIRDLLSNRRALRTALEAFLSALRISRRQFLPTTRAILAVLSEDRLTLSLQIELIIHGFPWEEVGQELMKRGARLHADALARAEQVIAQMRYRPDARLPDLEMQLAQSDDERLRRLALAALVTQAEQSGWSEEATARLQMYRDDPAPLVAEAAQFTFVS